MNPLPFLPALAGGAACLLAGMSLVYLASPNQRMLAAPLGRGGRIAGLMLAVAALGVFLAAMGAIAAVAVWGVGAMLAAILLPFLGLLWKRRP